MSGEFKVTREMAQELAETGAVQVPPYTLPHPDDLRRMLGDNFLGLRSLTMDYSYYAKSGLLPCLGSIAGQILSLSYGKDARWRRVRRQYFTPGIYENGRWHVDGEEGRLGGISFLFTDMTLPNERLETGGRGSTPRDIKTYSYDRGPVVIAQNEFGKALIEDADDCGATWHAGYRSGLNRVGALDFWLT